MQTFKALTLAADAATAVTVKNTSKADVTMAAKSVSFECKEGCGIDRPLGLLPDGLRHR